MLEKREVTIVYEVDPDFMSFDWHAVLEFVNPEYGKVISVNDRVLND